MIDFAAATEYYKMTRNARRIIYLYSNTSLPAHGTKASYFTDRKYKRSFSNTAGTSRDTENVSLLGIFKWAKWPANALMLGIANGMIIFALTILFEYNAADISSEDIEGIVENASLIRIMNQASILMTRWHNENQISSGAMKPGQWSRRNDFIRASKAYMTAVQWSICLLRGEPVISRRFINRNMSKIHRRSFDDIGDEIALFWGYRRNTFIFFKNV